MARAGARRAALPDRRSVRDRERGHPHRVARAARGDLRASSGCRWIFKASYDKANRSSHGSYRGPGPRARPARSWPRCASDTALPILTDVHEVGQVEQAAAVADVLQIPAFLCRQTDLVLAAARDRAHRQHQEGAVHGPLGHEARAREGGLDRQPSACMVTERGFTFGYNNLVVDMRVVPGAALVRLPGRLRRHAQRAAPGGLRRPLGRGRALHRHAGPAGVAAGVDGLFMEVHENPARALSDGPNALPAGTVEGAAEAAARVAEGCSISRRARPTGVGGAAHPPEQGKPETRP